MRRILECAIYKRVRGSFVMETLEKRKDKVKKICDVLRKETLEPTKQEAKEILENAQMRAKEIINKAESDAQKILLDSEKLKEEKTKALEASLKLASRQALESLKAKIEKELFQTNLAELVRNELNKKDRIADLITTLIQAIEKEGIDTDLSVYISEKVPVKEINLLLAKHILEKLKEKSVVLGDFLGGVKIELKDEKITLDMSDQAIIDLIAEYIRRDFRSLLFAT